MRINMYKFYRHKTKIFEDLNKSSHLFGSFVIKVKLFLFLDIIIKFKISGNNILFKEINISLPICGLI